MSNVRTPAQAVMKAYLRSSIDTTDFQRFRDALRNMFDHINLKEHESYNKKIVSKMLEDSLYHGHYMLNSKGNTDLAIYDEERKAKVLFEVKGPGRPDMVKESNMCAKAMYELVLYYLKEEFKERNTGITHLIITDCYKWFIFEKRIFYKYFGSKKDFVKAVLEAEEQNGTEYAYQQVIKPRVKKIQDLLEFAVFDMQKYKNKLDSDDIFENRNFRAVYKILSPIHLLRLQFHGDHNTLNQGFYDELLYIMGLHEITEKNTEIRKIVRFDGKQRQPYSLVEQVVWMMEDFDVDNPTFDATIGLALTWVNRLLFLKLLEAQIVRFNRDKNKKFLTTDKIPNYSILYQLFFKVLARKENERSQLVKSTFKDVPYLNSSLFEMSEWEKRYFTISNITNGPIKVFAQTKLKDTNGNRMTGEMPALEYLLRFLDAYDYVETNDEGSTKVEEQRTIISPSVLGLIFEKINGYKEGAYYTPGYITEYITRDCIRRAVVDKFNEKYSWNCEDFSTLKEVVDLHYREIVEDADDIFDQIKICDPAVGSGHFLVSALNEMVAVKRELILLRDRTENQKPITRYDITVEDDELVISDAFGDYFAYYNGDFDSQIVQEALFEEKKRIIENCLFGVDLNPNSVEICRLRLWIELLKHAYYYKDESDNIVLQTLPNIDINIKCGDSIYSRIPVQNGWEVPGAFKEKYDDIRRYKACIEAYKNCCDKRKKRQLNEEIENIKRNFKNVDQFDLFNTTKKTKQQFFDSYSLEWMFEFPEVIDEQGIFRGFDIIVGNPPYISLQKVEASPLYGKMEQLFKDNDKQKTYLTYDTKGDIYSLFVERALMLLKPHGYLSYIVPNKWMKVGYGKELRKLFLSQNLYKLVDFGDCQLFANATTYTCIIALQKEQPKGYVNIATLSKVNAKTLRSDIKERIEVFDTSWLDENIWVVSSIQNLKAYKRLKTSMKTLGEVVGRENTYRGIITGLTDAFSISSTTKDLLIAQNQNAERLIRPFIEGKSLRPFSVPQAEKYLLFIPKGFTLKGMGIDREKEEKPKEDCAWKWFSDHYPSVAEWLVSYEARAKNRQDQGDYWWELRACTYYDKFELPKIFYQVIAVHSCFTYDVGNTFCNNSIWFISTCSKRLLSLMMSKTFWWLISETCPRIQNGFQLIGDNFYQIPVPEDIPDRLEELANLIPEAVERNDQEQVITYQQEIDSIVSHLYKMEINVE